MQLNQWIDSVIRCEERRLSWHFPTSKLNSSLWNRGKEATRITHEEQIMKERIESSLKLRTTTHTQAVRKCQLPVRVQANHRVMCSRRVWDVRRAEESPNCRSIWGQQTHGVCEFVCTKRVWRDKKSKAFFFSIQTTLSCKQKINADDRKRVVIWTSKRTEKHTARSDRVACVVFP